MYLKQTVLFTFLLLSGCASQIPPVIKTAPESNISYSDLESALQIPKGQVVRWGGKIISVENKQDETLVEILSQELNTQGRPMTSDEYFGRFIARIQGFLDPEHYTKERILTVYGTIDGRLKKDIEEHPYTYPVIDASTYYLWPELKTVNDPYRYPRYYYPSYPFYSRPYYDPYFYTPMYPYF